MKQIILIMLILSSNTLLAQNVLNDQAKKEPITWSFQLWGTDTKDEIDLVAEVNLEPGFHLFAFEPGGDGLLIGTDIQLDDSKYEVIRKEQIGHQVQKEIEGLGLVNYYEEKVSYNIRIRTKEKKLQGSFIYQVCNDRMCFPPAEKSFDISIN